MEVNRGIQLDFANFYFFLGDFDNKTLIVSGLMTKGIKIHKLY